MNLNSIIQFKLTSVMIALVALCPLTTFAQLTHRITFNESDYHYETLDGGITAIYSIDPTDWYADGQVPCLPFSSKKLLLPYSSDVESYEITYGSFKTIKQNIVIAEGFHPIIGTTNSISHTPPTKKYVPISFPDSNIMSVESYEWQSMRLLTFDVTPFAYDATSKTLSFVNDITITINLKQRLPSSKMMESSSEVREVLKSWVENKESVDNFVAQAPAVVSANFLDKIEYILITTDELRETFQKLVNWKRARGVHAELVTLDRIDDWYEGADIQEKIKHCLYDLHLSYGCKYAVLGGDTIPTRSCYIEAYDNTTGKTHSYNNAPVDKYYGCFGGNFEWNANSNNLYGEVDDDIDFTESVYVSRIPVRTREDAEAYINKLIAYEKGSTSDNFSVSILTTGANLKGELVFGQRSDADIMGDEFSYKYLINWFGRRIRFYDTGNDFSNLQNYELTDLHLQEQLGKKHMFISMMTHGQINKWTLGSVFKTYSAPMALSLINKGSTIITTCACLTNAFDADAENEPCLSEAFIRGKSNGVIAYWGCSREGWMSEVKNELGPSMRYEGEFYKHLFLKNNEFKNYGKIISAATAAIQNQCSVNSHNRWIKMCLNTMGDAEMPIFTDKALKFSNVSLSFSEHNINIDAGLNNCNICIMSLDDYGKSYYRTFSNVRSVNVDDIPYFYSVSITKQGYEPYIFACRDLTTVVEYGPIDITGQEVEFSPTRYYILSLNLKDNASTLSAFNEITCIRNAGDNQIRIELNPSACIGTNMALSIHNVYGKLERTVSLSNNSQNTVTIDNLKDGTYIISLINDGEIAETKKINL